jgi:hypothetical protein
MVTHPEVATKGLLFSIQHLMALGGVRGLYVGLPWVLLRQIPYTCVKLAGYDTISTCLRHRYKVFKVHRVLGEDVSNLRHRGTNTHRGDRDSNEMGGTWGGYYQTENGEPGNENRGTWERKHPEYDNIILSPTTKVGLQLIAGITAGLLAAFVSQPADVILSKVCSSSSTAAVASAVTASATSCVINNSPGRCHMPTVILTNYTNDAYISYSIHI